MKPKPAAISAGLCGSGTAASENVAMPRSEFQFDPPADVDAR